MLDLSRFDRLDDRLILYEGEYLYYIAREEVGFSVDVEGLDENGDARTVARYAAGSLSVAIATIEQLESSGEIEI